jgi:hypothetical protein
MFLDAVKRLGDKSEIIEYSADNIIITFRCALVLENSGVRMECRLLPFRVCLVDLVIVLRSVAHPCCLCCCCIILHHPE